MRRYWNIVRRFQDWYVRECSPVKNPPWYMRFEVWIDFFLIVVLSIFLFVISDGLPFWRQATLTAIGPFFMCFMRLGLACQSLGYDFGTEKPEVMSRRFWGLLSLITFFPPLFGFVMMTITRS